MSSSTVSNAATARAFAFPVRFAIAGIGGYGGVICDTLLESPATRLIAAFDPEFAAHPDRVAQLQSRGVTMCNSFDSLLKQHVEAVWLPIPIHLHRPFTEQAVAAGIAVICEKPAAGTVQDVDAMIAAQNRTAVAAVIGYQQLCDPAIRVLKRRLCGGDFGMVRSISLAGCWPRASSYYQRNAWAGRLQFNGTWILDSPLSNAMSHYLQLALFLAGPSLDETAAGQHIEAELYRVNAIENYDTCSVRVRTAGGVSILALMTHAAERNSGPVIRIRCDGGDIRIIPDQMIDYRDAIDRRGDRIASVALRSDTRHQLAVAFHDFLRGTPDAATTIATLSLARAPVAVVNAASMAAAITAVPAGVATSKSFEDGTLSHIPGIELIFEACERDDQMLHESGRAAWSVPAGTMDFSNMREFIAPKTSVATP